MIYNDSKTDLSERVSATLAFYNITRSNVLTTDPNDSCFSIQTGKQQSRGVESDIAGKILPGWNIIAEILKDNTFARS